MAWCNGCGKGCQATMYGSYTNGWYCNREECLLILKAKRSHERQKHIKVA